MKKNFLAVLLVLLLGFGLMACSSPAAEGGGGQTADMPPAREERMETGSKGNGDSTPAVWVEETAPTIKPVDRWEPPEGSDVNLLKAMTETYLMEVSRIDLVLEHEPIHTVEDTQAVEGIVSLMANAPIQGGYSPMPWHTSPGFGLKFVFDDGTGLMVELGLDNDNCRMGNWTRTYGPENDYNAITELLALMGLDVWPQKVMDTYSEVFEQYPIVNGRHAWKPNYQFYYVPYEAYSEDKNFVTIQYPDGTKDGVGYGEALDMLFHLQMIPYDLTDQKEIAKEDCEYVLIFDFADGETREVLCMNEDRFFVQGDGIETAWTFTSSVLAAHVDSVAEG